MYDEMNCIFNPDRYDCQQVPDMWGDLTLDAFTYLEYLIGLLMSAGMLGMLFLFEEILFSWLIVVWNHETVEDLVPDAVEDVVEDLIPSIDPTPDDPEPVEPET